MSVSRPQATQARRFLSTLTEPQGVFARRRGRRPRRLPRRAPRASGAAARTGTGGSDSPLSPASAGPSGTVTSPNGYAVSELTGAGIRSPRGPLPTACARLAGKAWRHPSLVLLMQRSIAFPGSGRGGLRPTPLPCLPRESLVALDGGRLPCGPSGLPGRRCGLRPAFCEGHVIVGGLGVRLAKPLAFAVLRLGRTVGDARCRGLLLACGLRAASGSPPVGGGTWGAAVRRFGGGREGGCGAPA